MGAVYGHAWLGEKRERDGVWAPGWGSHNQTGADESPHRVPGSGLPLPFGRMLPTAPAGTDTESGAAVTPGNEGTLASTSVSTGSQPSKSGADAAAEQKEDMHMDAVMATLRQATVTGAGVVTLSTPALTILGALIRDAVTDPDLQAWLVALVRAWFGPAGVVTPRLPIPTSMSPFVSVARALTAASGQRAHDEHAQRLSRALTCRTAAMSMFAATELTALEQVRRCAAKVDVRA